MIDLSFKFLAWKKTDTGQSLSDHLNSECGNGITDDDDQEESEYLQITKD